MITAQDAIAVATAIVEGMNKELERCCADENFAVRRAALNALDNLWYDVIPRKTKEKLQAMYQPENVSDHPLIVAVFRKIGK